MDRRHDETDGGDLLERGLEALRGIDADADALQVVATRSRVLRSLDERSGRRRRSVATAIVATILGTGTLSWAWATGRLPTLMNAVGLSAPEATQVDEEPAEARRRRRAARIATPEVEPPVQPEPAAVIDTAPAPGEVPLPALSRPEPRPPASDELAPPRRVDGDRAMRALYRRAHETHFRGGDAAAALAAWDQYLAAAPTGRFAVEARYNRALTLVRLGRRSEAALALRPFADGDVAPAGYRQKEARALLRAIGKDAGGDDVDGSAP